MGSESFGFALLGAIAATASAGETLLTVNTGFDMGTVQVVGDADVKLVTDHGAAALRVEVSRGADTAGVTFPAPEGGWDLSEYDYVVIDVRNVGDRPARVQGRVENPGVDPDAEPEFGIHPDAPYVTGDTVLAPGQRGVVRVELRRHKPEWVKVDLFNMVCYPWGQCPSSDPTTPGAVDAANIAAIRVTVRHPHGDQAFEISGIRVVGRYVEPPEILKDTDKFFPFIDEYGQYIHADWPGKINADEDLAKARDAEAADLQARPGPADWDKWGGWAGGPTLEATGWFRTAKYNGSWWLVDPDGKLFISVGMDCVGARGGSTPIEDREKWFRNLPARDSQFGNLFGSRRGFPRGYYAGRRPLTFDFSRANLMRKYGPDWSDAYADLVHRRLRSWGVNTIGNWSDRTICRRQRTPYTTSVRFRSKPMEAVEGWWGRSPDPFDEEFTANIRRSMRGHAETTATDPWCIGYFVGNEMAWGAGETGLAKMILACPAEQAAKRVFIEDLKARYGTIDKLNAAWGVDHASWEALLKCTTPPEDPGADDDLVAFTSKACETYFRNVRDAVKQADPNHLYLGCRFAGGGFVPPAVMAAAGKYCDVVSFNIYRRTVDDYRMSAQMDVPMLIGEFSFWGLDRGKFNRGGLRLEAMGTQAERGEAYKAFVRSMLRHPQLVGCHWFQYMDQPTTGRGDGENFQFGFVDVADTPYTETVDVARWIGATMYEYRARGK